MLNAAETRAPTITCPPRTVVAPFEPELLPLPELPEPEPPEPEPELPVACAPAVVDGGEEGVNVAGWPDKQDDAAAAAAALFDGAALLTVALPPKSQDCALRLVAS